MAFTQALGAEALCRNDRAAAISLLPTAPGGLHLPDLCRPLLSGALQHCITATKGDSHTRPLITNMSAPPLHSYKVENKRSLASSTSCAIFGPNFLLQLCPCSVSISAATACFCFPGSVLYGHFPVWLLNHLHIVVFKTQLPNHKYS